MPVEQVGGAKLVAAEEVVIWTTAGRSRSWEWLCRDTSGSGGLAAQGNRLRDDRPAGNIGWLTGRDSDVGHNDDWRAMPAIRSARPGTRAAPAGARWRASGIRALFAWPVSYT